MSTERPDNDATDPVRGHAEGPVEGAAEDAVAGPPEGAVTDPAEDAAADPAEQRAENAAESHTEGHTEDQAEGSAEDRAEDLAESFAESQAEGSAENAAEDAAEGPAEDAADGTVDSAAASAGPGTPGTVAGSGQETDEGSGEGSAESPAGAVASADTGADVGASRSDADDDGGTDGEDSRAEHPDVSVAGPVPGPFADDEVGRARRRHTPMAIASVVAAVLLVGGGGAYVAATASGGSSSSTPAADGTPPRLALDGYAAATTGNGSTGGTAGIAPGEPNPYGTTYRASGTLPAGPGSAHVRWAEGTVTRAEVARLAKALGLAGTPRLAGDAWTVGTAADGTEPNLRVTADAPGTWTFSSSLPGGDNCAKVTVCAAVGSGSTSDSASAPGPVSEAAAEKAAAPVLKAVGQDDAKLDASQLMNRVRVVNADPVVGGLPTYGWTTGLRIGPDGHVVGGSGQLKTPVEGDAYPVIGAKKTLDLMNGSASATDRRRMGIGGCASPVPLKDQDETPCEHPSPAPKAEAVTVEKATFGLAAQRANGRQVLVPSWLFEVRSPGAQDTYTVTHPAVEPAFLASPESPAPPSADPTQPPDQPSSPAATRDVGVQGYTADGRDLTVDFTGGVCADYTVSASESSGKVTVTVTEKPWKNKVCILIAKVYEKTVRLDEPLGGREVVGSDGKAVHHGRFAIPEPSGAASAGPR